MLVNSKMSNICDVVCDLLNIKELKKKQCSLSKLCLWKRIEYIPIMADRNPRQGTRTQSLAFNDWSLVVSLETQRDWWQGSLWP